MCLLSFIISGTISLICTNYNGERKKFHIRININWWIFLVSGMLAVTTQHNGDRNNRLLKWQIDK
jgi:hypothetical protein